MGFSYLNPLQQALEALQKTSYEVDVQEVLESRQFDLVLDAILSPNYDGVLELIRMHHSLMYFSIRYTYHNLKVLHKSKFSGKTWKHLCVPFQDGILSKPPNQLVRD